MHISLVCTIKGVIKIGRLGLNRTPHTAVALGDGSSIFYRVVLLLG